ncbi:methyltransferase domain-containing protein [Klebsiella quasivariicola]|uniref:methyltransferase domain-containing protein n=1 Tax=Klebsiella quasivariicola TaxID=2026240 RepID=UPI00247AB0BA|nr:methyltransferase domain-containing protein [Klebsiella quasivariicola]
MLDLNADITPLHGAKYNPRHIDEADLNMLAESIRVLGLVKPLIARGNLLVAGHQRTKALRILGVTTAAVFKLPRETTVYDEIRFNQLHNGTDMDSGDENCRISGLEGKRGFCIVPPGQITGNLRARMATVRREISEMILKYGPWGGCVATESGEVIHCAQYALASLSVKADLTVYVIPDEKVELYRKYLSKSYGVFSYEHLERKTYVQTYAQMMRLRSGCRKDNKSRLYEETVLPWLARQDNAKSLRGIDFGSGQGDYAAMMRLRGFDFLDVELFRRKGAGNVIDLGAVNRMVSALCEAVKTHGLFDYVVCDSVLNSVDSPEAENAVLTVLVGMCKPGGTVFFSGRRLEFEQASLRLMKAGASKSRIYFLDENNFTAKYRKGAWFYQKFHSCEDVKAIAQKYGLKIASHGNQGSSFQVRSTLLNPPIASDLVKAIRFEFDMTMPDGNPLGRATDVLKAFGLECAE